jgi:hypothetical protein
MGAIGGHQAAQDQANNTNESLTRTYKHQLMVREAKWNNSLNDWSNRRTDFKQSVLSNREAAGRAYASEQQRLNEMYQQAAFSKQDMLTKLLQASGMSQASGRSGNSAQRLQTMHLAAYGRNNAVLAETLSSAKNAMKTRNEQTWYQQMSENNKAWNKVSMAPVPDIAPPPPQLVAGPSGMGLAAGLLGAVAQGASALGGLKAPSAGNFGTDASGMAFNGSPLGSSGMPNIPSYGSSMPATSAFQFNNPFSL